MAVRPQPQRTCIACRTLGDKRGLTRLVRSAEGRVLADTTGKLAGRGAYLCSNPQCWERALGRGGALAHALRTTVTDQDRALLLQHAPGHQMTEPISAAAE